MDQQNPDSGIPEVHKASKHRSPSYPAINLETAIRRANEFYAIERKNPAPFTVAAQHWGYKEKSSGALTTIAALKAFGLMRDVEGSATRRVQLTDDAIKILLDQRPNSKDREELIKQAALKPKLHKTLWDEFGADGFSDDNVRHLLIFDLSYNENSVNDIVKEYRDTISFALLANSDKLSKVDTDKIPNIDRDDQDVFRRTMEPQNETFEKPLVLPKTATLKPDVISTPVGKDENGAVAFAHVRFEAGIKKEYVVSLKKYLEYLEGTLQ